MSVSKTAMITGVTGGLGGALAELYAERGWRVIGVSRSADAKHDACERLVASEQRSMEDARKLLAEEPDLVILNAGRIEEEVGEAGMPLAEATREIYEINALFPSYFAIAAGESRRRPLDVVAIGSIADGSPSSFGPVYHASKIALHYFYTGVGPIANHADPGLRLRLYRPGVIKGRLSWAPVLRLNERGRKVRARRCEGAPEPRAVATRIADWIEGDGWVGSYDEPLSFRALRVLFALAPNLTYRLQRLGWRKGSRFETGARARSRREPGASL